jgi:hypothetical protein
LFFSLLVITEESIDVSQIVTADGVIRFDVDRFPIEATSLGELLQLAIAKSDVAVGLVVVEVMRCCLLV